MSKAQRILSSVSEESKGLLEGLFTQLTEADLTVSSEGFSVKIDGIGKKPFGFDDDSVRNCVQVYSAASAVHHF